jgi:integrase
MLALLRANRTRNGARSMNWRGTWGRRNRTSPSSTRRTLTGNNAISFARKKTGSVALLRFGDEVANILHGLPATGPLFPYLHSVRCGDRTTEFKERCVGLGIHGVSLHSYRYAWAERAKVAGYPERFA